MRPERGGSVAGSASSGSTNWAAMIEGTGRGNPDRPTRCVLCPPHVEPLPHHLTGVNHKILVSRPPSGLVPDHDARRRYEIVGVLTQVSRLPLKGNATSGLVPRSIARLIPGSPKSRLQELVP